MLSKSGGRGSQADKAATSRKLEQRWPDCQKSLWKHGLCRPCPTALASLATASLVMAGSKCIKKKVPTTKVFSTVNGPISEIDVDL